MIIPVILAGGSGTRLWPLSRQHYPKQLLKLFGDRTMLQQTLLRLEGLPDLGDPVVVCNEEHRFMVAEQLQEIGQSKAAILLEPLARNTAPALALAAVKAQTMAENPTLLVLAADHVINDVPLFHQAVATAVSAAEAGHLVTFGVEPTRPETGYGYIKTQHDKGAQSYFPVQQFAEKPDLATAQSYLAQGGYYWNSGMFVFQAEGFLAELESYSPDVLAAAQKSYQEAVSDLDFVRVDRDAFAAAPNISIDYAVMENSEKVVCVPFTAGWSDVGCWQSFWELSDKDEQGNSFVGDSIDVGSTDTLVFSQDKLVATIGVNNLMVINTPDAVLVADKSAAQEVKAVIAKIQQQNRTEHLQHREIYRPWGCYDSVDEGTRYQVKRITVKPGARLSLQMHYHRAEHWIVVRGTAEVQKGDETLLLSENESTFIPVGMRHRLSNPGKIPLELIEVQSGPYLGEDDIQRFDDNYGRS
ncbi:mannose-1-phosphate guanylyltransferase/mannose-6-phosphate isomerase [Marinimicrobium sp. ABcell2]|uniref:mannose-1-phosphate guanylyltransferase/mannose-6-phosphate isomerase n=1 Tax=Marinimicrobium sp. ABcell2 TaxID=3069751 RepID=UPI0027B3BEA9|nr:mannose-1-phosphate guanylyltransferase/mannose-6-phosphate isomerase [Marinimicrobium sp. ABcell2]MDQ2078052.1 mannose-1-phosphate guanylyltransferase/mannose-6-phosphate isomerase [Marinimicrobium sp. ABcell2]